MDGKLNVFEAIGRRMGWLGKRQEVLAQNLANADTPGYTPRDMKASPFASLVARRLAPVAPAVTRPNHIAAGPAPDGRPAGTAKDRDPYETAPAGNAVVLEEQLAKIAETQMDYQTMTNLYSKHMQMIRAALGRGGS